ncbi:MAG TPA: hypothetical protein VHQ47_13040 [Phycisphaerae bacterium]|jgi:hypothetical protein|nr:hypothetical protein [Phycisphaerae bacterium]
MKWEGRWKWVAAGAATAVLIVVELASTGPGATRATDLLRRIVYVNAYALWIVLVLWRPLCWFIAHWTFGSRSPWRPRGILWWTTAFSIATFATLLAIAGNHGLRALLIIFDDDAAALGTLMTAISALMLVLAAWREHRELRAQPLPAFPLQES